MNTNQIQKAVALLKQGEVIAFPTDTLYGLGADPHNEQAIAKIFAIKGRSYQQALPVLLPKIADLYAWVDHNSLANYGLTQKLLDLVENFWPGPLTIVLKKAKNVSNLLTANQDTIALRVPNHPVALDLLQAFNSGIIGTSANKSGDPGLISADQVSKSFGEDLFVLSGEKIPLGLGSTIVSLISEVKILRTGAINVEELQRILGNLPAAKH